jgi:hypothetical protein
MFKFSKLSIDNVCERERKRGILTRFHLALINSFIFVTQISIQTFQVFLLNRFCNKKKFSNVIVLWAITSLSQYILNLAV